VRRELIVVGVRTDGLLDAIRYYLMPQNQAALQFGGAAWTLVDVRWAAERLESACERALGTRRRHYDVPVHSEQREEKRDA
jgi:hypothetical protein